ncbi:MAG: hypothetical protein ABII02_04890 [Candidatus Magasanikbacteria bacterium]
MNTKTAAGISAIVIALTAGIFSVAALGDDQAPEQSQSGKAFQQMGKKGQGRMIYKGQNSENLEAVQAALASGDYTAWKDAVGDKGMSEYVTEENFDQFVQIHNLMKSGDKDGAKAIAEELGLPEIGQMKGEHREAVQAAVEAGDYAAFQEAVGDGKMAEVIIEENFGRFIEMHNHMDAAKTIAEELGLPQHRMRGRR